MERIDTIQITNIIFFQNRFSILTNSSIKSMGRFRIQLLLKDNTWKTTNHIAKNSNYSSSSTEWSLLILDSTEPNYGIRLFYNKTKTAHVLLICALATLH